MGNFKAFYRNAWDNAAVIFSSGASVNYPIGNLQKRNIARRARLTGVTGIYIKITGTAIDMSGIFLFGLNCTALATITIKGSDDDFASTPFSEVLDHNSTTGIAAFINPSTVNYDYWKIEIEDSTNTDGYIEIGRVHQGDMWEPENGYGMDAIDIIVDPSQKMTVGSRQAFAIIEEHYNTWRLPFGAVNGPGMRDFIGYVGKSREFVMVKKPWGYTAADYPDIEDNSYYVSLKSYSPKRLVNDIYVLSLDIEEER